MRPSSKRTLTAAIVALAALVFLAEAKAAPKSEAANEDANKPAQSNFYFHTPNSSSGRKKPTHLISNRNAASAAASAAATRLLKQKQGGKNRLVDGSGLGLAAAATTPPPHPIQVNVTAKVGETVMLACVINSAGYNGLNPGVIWMQGNLGNVLTLNTNRITVDQRFEIVQQPLPSQSFQMSHRERPSLAPPTQNSAETASASAAAAEDSALEEQNDGELQKPAPSQHTNDVSNYYHLKITNVQLYDENEYACETSITKRTEDQPNLHSLVYLHVTQSPSFIETLTSESNLAAVEFADVVLKCFAVGKPLPKIRWYQIDESNGSIRDLNHEGTSLTISNISKSDNSKYECVASNGILPSVSKKFTITVYYSPLVRPVLQKTNQYMEQTVALGCVINSNPDSNVNWHKLVQTDSLNVEPLFEPIDATNGQKYQVHKYKQANQTVSYLKIRISNVSDYTKYKCEATNLVGKGDTIIELLELKDTPRNRPHGSSSGQGSSDEEIELDDGEYLINLENGRNDERNGPPILENEYQLMNGQKSGRKKLAKMSNLVNGASNEKNNTQLKYQLSKTNRIVNTNDEDDPASSREAHEEEESGNDGQDQEAQIDNDSETHTNRLNSFLSSESSGHHVTAQVAMLISSVVGLVLVTRF